MDSKETAKNISCSVQDASDNNPIPTFVKLVLQESDEWTLYESVSESVPAESEKAAEVKEDNARYKYLTQGRGRNRQLSNAEAQTSNALFKTRGVNTEQIKRDDVATFVSNYDMFDTYADLATKTTSLESRDDTKIVITTYLKEGEVDPCEGLLSNTNNFRLSSMVLERICAGNVFREKQKRFRNMTRLDPLAEEVNYKYRLEALWTYFSPALPSTSVMAFSWNGANGDLVAIAYGKFYCTAQNQDTDVGGCVAVWNIKNPVNPERVLLYDVSVTAVAFSTDNAQLLAVGLVNGRVEIRDICSEDRNEFLAKSDYKMDSPGFEPIWQIVWLRTTASDPLGQVLTISQDGRIMKYSFTTGPYLRAFLLLRLNSVEGVVEGLSIAKSKKVIEGNRHPQALCIRMHATKADTYLVGTNEGCVHQCSINYSKHHSAVLQVHNGSVFSFEYSPWSPKIFLTCGSDWFIRIWIEGVFTPVVELSNDIGGINCATWCPIHSTVIACCTSKAVSIWDIRRRILKPVAVKTFPELGAPITVIEFSKCGTSLLVGAANGKATLCALDDMPFPPHFQFNALENAIHKALNAQPILLEQIKSMELGYANGRKREESENR